jgi:thymidine phosphorylase
MVNGNVKHDVIEMIKRLPDEVGYDDIMAEIYFRQKVDKSLKQIDEGKVISHEEVKQRISKWIK